MISARPLEMLMDLGHVFKDVESFVLTWGTGGIEFTTEALANATSSSGDAPWDVTRHTYLRAVGATRFALSFAFICDEWRKSTWHPDEVRGGFPFRALHSRTHQDLH